MNSEEFIAYAAQEFDSAALLSIIAGLRVVEGAEMAAHTLLSAYSLNGDWFSLSAEAVTGLIRVSP